MWMTLKQYKQEDWEQEKNGHPGGKKNTSRATPPLQKKRISLKVEELDITTLLSVFLLN